MDLSVRRDSRVGDAIMDLSSRGITVTRMIDCGAPSVAATAAPLDMSSRQHQNNNHNHNAHQQRSLRPRTSATSYAEGLDVVVIEDEPDPAASNFSAASLTRHRAVLDGCDSDVVPADVASWQQQDDEEKPLPPPVKPLSGEERARRLDMVRRLRNELRTEETKLVLLQRMKHFQMNDAGLPSASPAASVRPLNNSSNSGAAGRATSALTVSAVRPDVKTQVKPPPAHHNRIGGGAGASSVSVLSVSSGGDLSRLTAAQQNRFKSAVAAHQGGGGAASSTAFSYPLTSEVDIRRDSPVPQAPPAAHAKQHHSLSSHYQQQQQKQPQAARQQQQHYQVSVEKRQAAAKLALRRQLEKTLLQIPPPKPPPPHMSFVPNGSNAQFVYLLGLEKTVDYLKSEGQHNQQQAAAGTGAASTACENFVCSQCGRDFTPVWRLDSDTATTIGNNSSARTTATGGGGVRVTCEECVTSNVKKKLKAEHTSRLKAAFVKALQQEHEIETQLNKLAAAAAVVSGSPSPVPSPASGAPPPPPTPPTPETTITPIPNSGVGNMGRRDLNISQQHHSARHHNTHHAPHHHSHHHSHHHGSRSSPRPRDSPRHQQHVNSTDRSSRAGPSSSSSSAAAAAAAKLSAAELEYMKKLADPKYAASALLNPVMMAAAMNQSAAAALASAQQQLLRLPTSTSAATSSSSSISSQQQQQQQQQMLAAAAAGTFNPLLYSYQLAMAQVAQQQQQQQQAAVAAAAAKNPAVSGGGGHTAATAAATQQALADLQRQYLLDMIPSQQVLPPGWPRNAGSNNGTGGGAKR